MGWAGCSGSPAVQPATPPTVIDGRCAAELGMCLTGDPAPAEPGPQSGWRCLGINGGLDAACAVPASGPPPREGAERSTRQVVEAAPVRQPAGAQGSRRGPGAVAPRTQTEIGALLAAKAKRTPAQRKVGSRLLELAAAATGESSQPSAQVRPPAAAERAPQDGERGDDRVLVDIRADVAPAVLARIRELGGSVVNSVARYQAVRALLPLSSIERLAALDAVRTIRTADQAVTRKNDTSEGVVAHRANLARRTHGIDGTGIGIGVLSNGVRTLADRQRTGDLPAQVTVLPGQEGRGDEGTALLEIVHDIAPGADLYFATAFGGEARFAANIEALCEAGADVIVDDVGFRLEATLQDSVITQGVDAAVGDGCFYFSAAGNNGNLNDGTSNVWEGDYAAGSALVVDGETLGVRHDFGAGAKENPVAGGFLGFFTGIVVLQWADPWGASSNDYDLFLVDADGEVFASSTNTQDGTQDPIEVISAGFFAYEDARLVVVKHSGADRYLRLQAFDGRLDVTTAGTTYGHAAAEKRVGCRTGGCAHGTGRRLQGHRVRRYDQLRRSPPGLLRRGRHAAYAGRLLFERREGAAEAGPRRRELRVDGDAGLLAVLRHIGGGAARGGHRRPDAGGGRRPGPRQPGAAPHRDGGGGPGHRGGGRRPRFRRRHRDGRGRSRCRRHREGGPQPGADRGAEAGRPDAGARLRRGDARPREHLLRSGRRHAGLCGGVERSGPAGNRPQRRAGDADAGLAGPA